MPRDFLHNHPQFADLIRIVADEKGIDPALVEKDYWIMHCLYGLQQLGFKFQLKGGTSLSKGHQIINRFSEDIDILIEPPPGRDVKMGKNQNSPAQIKTRTDFYDWLAQTIKIDGISNVERDTAFDDIPRYRERVYCYELYHQLRCHWPAETPYYLNGEVDKGGHPFFRELGRSRYIPDLLVHRPGYMSGNHAVIEVKHARAVGGLRKDLETLSLFVNRVGYQRAILLIYGDEANEAKAVAIRRIAARVNNLAPIELWFHQAVGLSYPQ